MSILNLHGMYFYKIDNAWKYCKIDYLHKYLSMTWFFLIEEKEFWSD